MTFTTRLKEEISKNPYNDIEALFMLEGFFRYNASISDNITIMSENASIIRLVYKLVKECTSVVPIIRVRIQKRFHIKQIYILEINEKVDYIKNMLNLDRQPVLEADEEKIAFLKGAFLGVGNVSNPKTSGYHLEYILQNNDDAMFIAGLLNYFRLTAKVIKRGHKYVTYMKMSENISDLIKMFQAINSLFEFEDTRIYRDHKNMVNRLNNCEIANQEKTIKTGMSQLEDIKYLEENDLLTLIDDKMALVLSYRKKYPETSYQELADIISLETDYKVGKSGINHHFIKLKKIKENHLNNTNK